MKEKKMKKPKLSNEVLLKKEPYRSILRLMELSGVQFIKKAMNPSMNIKTGLTPAHLLCALMDETTLKKHMSDDRIFELENYLNGLYPNFNSLFEVKKWSSSYLKKGVIISPQQLNEKLVYLIKRKWIVAKGIPRYYKYYLTQKYVSDYLKMRKKEEIDKWPSDSILLDRFVYYSLRKRVSSTRPHKGSWVLCGFPEKVLNNFSGKDKKDFINYLSRIEYYLDKIVDIKIKNDGLFEDIFWPEIGFYYMGIELKKNKLLLF